MFDGLLRFQIPEKWANLRFPLNIRKQKVFQLQGASPSDPLTRGFAPGPRWGFRPQTPVIGSRSARIAMPPLPNPKYAAGRSYENRRFVCINFLLFVFLQLTLYQGSTDKWCIGYQIKI